jgi:quinol monooxygenase YgiN
MPQIAARRFEGDVMSDERLTLVVLFRARAGREEALGEALLQLLAPTRREPGCVVYDLHRAVDDPAVYFFHEIWESPAHLRAHDGTDHVRAFLEDLPDLVAGPITKVPGHRIEA